MKILDSIQEQPKPFQPVGVVFETKEELEFVTKLIGMTSNNVAGNILNNDARFYDVGSMYKMLEEKCKEYSISVGNCGRIKYESEE